MDEALEETKELAITSGLKILETIVQPREKLDPKYCVGAGKADEIVERAKKLDADLILFHQNLSPNQSRNVNNLTPLPVIDRTQLILDIFAQRAKSHDGKLQVELAQLRYTIPRLRERDTKMSRLVGGIGGRGPGETKLEIHQRRARDKMARLERQMEEIAKHRATARQLRKDKRVPIVAIVGYTNAGKSTLLNTLTHAEALAEDKPFATLDPFSKRLRFPKDREIVLTDTVGFIRDLPPDLIAAFRATLEEIGEADLIVHVIDVSTEGYDERMKIVDQLLEQLGYREIPRILALNKVDRLSMEIARVIGRTLDGIPISARASSSLRPLMQQIETRLWRPSVGGGIMSLAN